MADSILQSSRPVDEKAVIQHHENSDTSQHSHQKMIEPGLVEAMHESEKDIPVGFGCSICGCDNTDLTKMTFRRFMGFAAMAFLWTGSQIPVYLFGMSKNNVETMI